MNKQARLRSNLWKLALYWVFHGFILAYVIERLFYQQRGMTVQHVVYLEIIYGVIIALLELPTGAIADRWSRKGMLVLGGIFAPLEFLILIYARSFWHFALATLVAALHGAMTSGTSNALLYDSLLELGRQKEFEKLTGRVRFADRIAHMLAALLGSVVAVKLGLLSTYWFSFASMIGAFLTALTLVEPDQRTVSEKAQHPGIVEIARDAVVFFKGYPPLRFVVFYGVVVGSCLVYLDEFWQLYLNDIGIPIVFFGVISGLSSMLTSLSGLVAYRVKDRFSYRVIFAVVLASFSLGLMATGLFRNPIGLLFMLFAFACAGLVEPLVDGYLHHRVPSDFRATAESVQSLISRLTTGLIGLIFGYVSTHSSVSHGFVSLGLLLVGYGALFGINSKVIEERIATQTLSDQSVESWTVDK